MFVLEIVDNTPFWVWIMLAYLLWQGVQALQDQTVSLRRLILVPMLFAAWGVETMLAGHPGPLQTGCWLAAVLVLLPIGFLTGPTLRAVDPDTGSVRRAGSAGPLLRSSSVFTLKYGSAVAVALQHPPSPSTLAAAAAISGATAGYFAGWLLVVHARHRAAPRLSLSRA